MNDAGTPARPGHGRILGIDYGERRVGLALSDESQILATALGTLEQRNRVQLCREIIDVVRQHRVARIVVGLPLNMKGREGPMALAVREFAERLRTVLDQTPIEMFDERFTTREAHRVLREAEVDGRRRKDKVDKLAAQLMLQTYLDRLRPFGEDDWDEEQGTIP